MTEPGNYPADFLKCVEFHGHVCPGLAIGYAAVKAGRSLLNLTDSPDEEVVAIVENDSCAVDAVQVMLSCTFGKGNLIFRDWGKQVYTFVERASGRAVRVSLTGSMPGREERHAIKIKMDSGQASDQDRRRFEELRNEAVTALVGSHPGEFFQVKEIQIPLPPRASIALTRLCDSCSELTMEGRLVEKAGGMICWECATRHE